MIRGIRILLIALALLESRASGTTFNCEEADSKEVKGTCLLKNITLLSADEISNVTFPSDAAGGSLRMVQGHVPSFSLTMANKLAYVKDLTVDEMRIRELVVWPSWEHLSAQDNRITAVSLAGANVDAQLRTLYLQGNQLTSVPPLGRRFNQLKVLQLDGNRLTNVSLDSFAGLEQLQTLSLASNQLIQVRAGTGRPVQFLKLKHLSLANNRLMELGVSRWAMESLQLLDLSGNGMFQLDVRNLGQFRALNELKYAGNDWNCEWLSAMQWHLKEKAIAITDQEPTGRCESENFTSLHGICCYEPATQDFLLDLYGDRWEKLNGLQRFYELVKFNYDRVELADINEITERGRALRESLSGAVATEQDDLGSALFRLRSSVADEAARMERLATRIDREVAAMRLSIEELYQRATRPTPSLNAVLQQSLTESINVIDVKIKELRRRIREKVSQIVADENRMDKLDNRIAELEEHIVQQKDKNRDLNYQFGTLKEQVDAAFNLLEKRHGNKNHLESIDSDDKILMLHYN